MGRKSQKKGSAGEREFLQLLQMHGIEAQRNDQKYTGGVDNPDICAQIGGRAIHFEVKRTERFRLYDSIEQAQRDANGHRVPVVAHRMNRRPWVVVLTFDDFLHLIGGKSDISDAIEIDDFDFSDLERQLDHMKFDDFSLL